jgi:hypothetical protein
VRTTCNGCSGEYILKEGKTFFLSGEKDFSKNGIVFSGAVGECGTAGVSAVMAVQFVFPAAFASLNA